MKLYSMQELQDFTDSDLAGIINERSKKFIDTLAKTLKGEIIEAFGNSKGLWNSCDTVKSFAIQSVRPYGQDDLDAYVEGGKVMLSLNIGLKGYNQAFVNQYGLMYTDARSEQAFKKLFFTLLGNQASVSWSEQGMQGDDYINLDFSFPLYLVAPDVAEFYKIQNKYQKMLQDVDKNLNTKLKVEDSWLFAKKKNKVV